MTAVIRVILVLTIFTHFIGCEVWQRRFRGQNEDAASTLLNKAQMSPDSVVVEISIITFPASKSHLLDEFLQTLDTNRIDLNQRKAWDRNGMIAAIGSIQLPAEFEKLLEVEETPENSDEQVLSDTAEETRLTPRRRLQTRSGKAFRIATRSVQPELSWFVIEKDGYRHGGSQVAAQTEFEVRSITQGDGGTRLIVEPELVYGPPRQSVTSTSNSLRYEMKRDAIGFGSLRLDAELALGESMILCGTTSGDNESGFGLGRTFFSSGEGTRKLVILRLAQSQVDNLFNSAGSHAPLDSFID